MAEWGAKVAIIVAFIPLWGVLCVRAQEGGTNEASDQIQSTSASQPAKKHQDAKDDINAIGNRRIGGTGAGN